MYDDRLTGLGSFITSMPREFLNIGVIGSRDGISKDFAYHQLRNITRICIDNGLTTDQLRIISGGARGADTYGAEFGADNNFAPAMIFIPDWDKFGKRAGYIRNHTIVDHSDFIVAFWDAKSKGTAHSIKLAISMKKIVIIFTESGSLNIFNMNNIEIKDMF